ncbi:hypothetical protein [Rubellicoccus peritrichatus]|uniref:Uncharacterized protein n=1 Tax=Rubellicoccus peritrichatus TaxID=3080537 RepID=A0AAQ3QU75_9BACT|nr:hypothetical protein [Puniceicoccus sp. CR14]WOO39347.1 hypothetical protein RZN69_12045 [Puniceicoccus sp. CR14]
MTKICSYTLIVGLILLNIVTSKAALFERVGSVIGPIESLDAYNGQLIAASNRYIIEQEDGSGGGSYGTVYVSDDAGATWRNLNLESETRINIVEMAVSAQGVVFVGKTDRNQDKSYPAVTARLQTNGSLQVNLISTEGMKRENFWASNVAFGNGRYIMSTENGYLYTSVDGLNWEKNDWTPVGNTRADIDDLIWDGSRFVLVVGPYIQTICDDSDPFLDPINCTEIEHPEKFYQSSDGLVWTQVESNLPESFLSLSISNLYYMNSHYVLRGTYYSAGGGIIEDFNATFISEDLINWTDISGSFPLTTDAGLGTFNYAGNSPVGPFASGNGYMVTERWVNGVNYILFSQNGLDWQILDSGLYSIRSLYFVAGSYFAVGRRTEEETELSIFRATQEFIPQRGSLPAIPPANPWASSFIAGPSAFYNSNLGFFIKDADSQWAYSDILGWIYPVGDFAPDLWLYVFDQDNWMYTTRSFEGLSFRITTGLWYFYDVDTNFFYPNQ